MAKLPIPKFNLRLPKGDAETLISLVYRYRGKRMVYSTGFSIHPKDWDAKTQRPINQERRKDLFAIQRFLDDLARYCTSIFIEHDYGAISVADFKKQLDIKTRKVDPTERDASSSFIDFLDEELEDMKAGGMKKNTLKMFRQNINNIKAFAAQYNGGKGFSYEDVDWNLRIEMIDWLTEKGVQLAYGNKTLKTFRQFMERARRKRLHTNINYQGVGWTVTPKRAKGEMVILTTTELQTLADMELTGHLAKIRDMCLIGAGTGQRFGDFSRFTPNNFYRTLSGIPLLSLISNKTNTPTKVPLNIFPWLIPVLERNDYTTPEMSMQKFNEGMKELCRRAGFDAEILKVEQYMGRKARVEKSYVKKYRLVSSHCCRRSFATNLYREGYRLSQIMPMTGHSTETQLREYIGIDAEMNAEEIALNIMEQRGKHPGSASVLKVVGA